MVVHPDTGGWSQVANILSDYSDLGAIHLVSHGASASLKLGDAILDRAYLQTHASEVSSWGSALAPDGDLLIYGCNVAASIDGQLFIDELAGLTRADVAASENATAASSIDGDWHLEYSTGETLMSESTTGMLAALEEDDGTLVLGFSLKLQEFGSDRNVISSTHGSVVTYQPTANNAVLSLATINDAIAEGKEVVVASDGGDISFVLKEMRANNLTECTVDGVTLENCLPSPFQLHDKHADFIADNVKPGDRIYNISEDKYVGVISVDSKTQLTTDRLDSHSGWYNDKWSYAKTVNFPAITISSRDVDLDANHDHKSAPSQGASGDIHLSGRTLELTGTRLFAHVESTATTLRDTKAHFGTKPVEVGDSIYNITEGKSVNVVGVDSQIQLTTSEVDNWVGDVYVVGKLTAADNSNATVLIDPNATFSTDGVQVGDVIYNVNEGKSVKVVSVDSETKLTTEKVDNWSSDQYVTITDTADADSSETVLQHATASFVTDGVKPRDLIYNITEGKTVRVLKVESETKLTTAAVGSWAGDQFTLNVAGGAGNITAGNITAGNITIEVKDTIGPELFDVEWALKFIYDSEKTKAQLSLRNVDIRGHSVRMDANSDCAHKYPDQGTDEWADYERSLDKLPGFLTQGAFSGSIAEAQITISSDPFDGTSSDGETTIIGNSIDIHTESWSDADVSVSSTTIGVAITKSETRSTLRIEGEGKTTITADNNVTLTSQADGQVSSVAFDLFADNNVQAVVGYADSDSTALTIVGEETKIVAGGDISISAALTRKMNVSASSATSAEGYASLGMAYLNSTTNVQSTVNGSIDATGNVSITADAKTPKNDISAGAGIGGMQVVLKGLNRTIKRNISEFKKGALAKIPGFRIQKF